MTKRAAPEAASVEVTKTVKRDTPVDPDVLEERTQDESLLADNIASMLEDRRQKFTYKNETYYLRWPRSYERDAADLRMRLKRQNLLLDPEIAELHKQPLPDADKRALLERCDRLMASRKGLDEWRKNRIKQQVNDLAERAATDTAADGIIREQVAWARSRYLAPILLEKEDGSPVVNDETTWEDLDPSLQDMASQQVVQLMSLIYLIPFFSQTQSGDTSS